MLSRESECWYVSLFVHSRCCSKQKYSCGIGQRERGSVLILSQERIQTATPVCLFEAALARRPFITLTYFTDKYTHYYTYFVVICVFYLAHTHTKSVNVCWEIFLCDKCFQIFSGVSHLIRASQCSECSAADVFIAVCNFTRTKAEAGCRIAPRSMKQVYCIAWEKESYMSVSESADVY